MNKEMDDRLNRTHMILLKILSKIPLFSGFSNGSKLALISICRREAFKEGEIIVEQGSSSDKMLLIISGYVDIILNNNQLIATIKPGNLFGEMGVFTGEKRTATAIARTNVDCFAIYRDSLHTLLLKNAIMGRDLLKNVVNMMAEKIRENNLLIEEMTERIEEMEKPDTTTGTD